VDVLKTALGISFGSEAEEFFEFVIPCSGNICDFQGSCEEGAFEFEAEENVEIVSGFVSFDADWGISGTINSGEEFIERDFAKMVK
jgi:hypothetical protein